MQNIAQDLRKRAKTIGYVPTMGALHEGHLRLIRQAQRENDIVVVSIFVNPIQFSPAEDFSRYPRPIKQDISLCRRENVDFLFYPRGKEMYPLGFKTYVLVEQLGDVLCGASRRGHFRGVATVVTKFFNILQPDRAYFGQKDAQQAIIIQRMVEDLNMPIKIRVMPIVRHKSGLALSSRNIYLNEQERQDALCLSQALKFAKDLVKSGERDCQIVTEKIREFMESKKTARIEYISIVDFKNLKPVEKISDKCLIALAVHFGKTRLIDNIVVKPS
jgi:pantoate--beta-alanine ligase